MRAVEVVFLVYAGILGAALGSFLNVCIARLPERESLIRPRSRCPNCGHQVAWYDNVPIVSFLALRGKCRGCRQPISWQYPAIEGIVAVTWVLMAWHYGPTWDGLRGSLFFTILIGIAVIDARHYLIPDVMSLGGLGAGLALSLLPGTPTPLYSVIGAALGFGVLLLVGVGGEMLFKKPAMGGGDMKMMAMVGAFLGPAGAMLTIFLGALAGTLIFGPISLKTGKLVPFGVFLAVGGAVTFLFGDAVVEWYRVTILGG